jgi:hypothetical protein
MCCGRNRPSLPSMGRVSQPLRTVHHGGVQPSAPTSAVTYFQYNGRTAMTVHGPVSGTVYRFHAPGRRVVVDLRDRASLTAIPQLAEVSSL